MSLYTCLNKKFLLLTSIDLFISFHFNCIHLLSFELLSFIRCSSMVVVFHLTFKCSCFIVLNTQVSLSVSSCSPLEFILLYVLVFLCSSCVRQIYYCSLFIMFINYCIRYFTIIVVFIINCVISMSTYKDIIHLLFDSYILINCRCSHLIMLSSSCPFLHLC